jgi:two-component system sensor histidine kinase ResE
MSTTVSQLSEKRDLKTSGIAMAVHDLKGYLAVISGQAKLLHAGKLGAVTPQQEEALADIVSGCRQIEEQISRLLTPGSCGFPQWKPVFSMTDLGQSLLGVYTLLRPEFTENHLQFDIELSEHAMLLPFDARLVRQVLLNLLENARRFTPPGGRVTISLKPHFWERRNSKFRAPFEGCRAKPNLPNTAEIIVADTGCGVPSKDHDAIFEEYFSTPDSGSNLSSGLGLTIARKIVQAHGGKIWVESAEGTGSRFCFVLPFVAPSSTEETQMDTPATECR